MQEITEEEFEQNFDHYMDLIEKQKTEIIIRLSNGRAVAAVPFPDELTLDQIEKMQYNDVDFTNDDDDSAESPA
jgi:hypothetical protein